MQASKLGLWGCCLVGVFGAVGNAAEFALLPVSSTGSHTINGDEIVLDGGGQRVTMELFISDWGPDSLLAYQAVIEASGYSSGLQGTLAPPIVECVNSPDPCPTAIGPGSVCPFPPTNCPAGFIASTRSDYVFLGVTNFPVVDVSTLNYRYGATLFGPPVADQQVAKYVGSLVLDVPVGSMGTFTIDLVPGAEGTYYMNQASQVITSVTLAPALITITCQGDEDCDDGLYCNGTKTCTDGVCVGGSGDPCPGPDGDADCAESCNETADNCTANDPVDAGCDLDGLYCTDDTCDGAGTCDPGGDPCPGPDGDNNCSESCNEPTNGCTADDPEDSPCDDDLYCSGTETCTGGVCGNNTGDPCPGPDGDGDCTESCDEEANDCLEADPDGSPCNDGQYCNENETCTGGVCGDGTDMDCDDGLPCTDDSCDELDDLCVNALTEGYCLITDVCYADGELSPDNDCQECDPAISTTDWSFRPAGSECDDGDPCTGTGREGIDDDTCDGAGECAGELDPECNDQCAFAIEAFEGMTTGNNEGSGPDDVEASCQPDSNNDVWFVYTATCTGTTFVSTTGSEFAPANDPVLSIYDACPDQGGAEIACDDDSGAGLQAALTFGTVADTPYWIRVAGFEDSAGSIALNIEPFDECLMDGICYPEGAINPGNDCEACIPEVATMAWSPRPEGATCGDSTDTDCNGYDACDGAGVCEPNYKVEGSACGDPSDTECDNPDTCDGVGACLPNYEVQGAPCGNPDDTQCDNPDICDDMGLCDDNFEVDGEPCNDENVCTEDDVCDTGLCVGTPIPQAPAVVSEGPRHLAVTPQPVGSVAPVALLVTSPDWTCVSKYIQADGLLGSDPVFQLPDEWDTVVVQSPDLVPSSTYEVVAECGTYTSALGSATTAIFGDIVGEATAGEWGPPDGRVDVLDLTAIVEAFRHLPTAPGQERSDLWPCTPDGVIDVLDMTMVADAFQGYSYWDSTGCPVPCP